MGVQQCSHCGQSFWPSSETTNGMPVCPTCERIAQMSQHSEVAEVPGFPVSAAPVPAPASVRFAPLSSLPPERRVPARRQTAAPQPVPASVMPRQLPGLPDVKASKIQLPQLGFNCPSCYAYLTIKDPEQYDGRAAPCPNCQVVILPPRIAPASPFSLTALPPAQQTGPRALPAPRPASTPAKLPPPRSTPAKTLRDRVLGAKNGLAKAAII